MKVFICYRREESAYPAQQLYTELKTQLGGPESVVFDVDSIPMGADFRSYLDGQVKKCDILLAIIGDRWLDILTERLGDPKDFVRIEIQSALQAGLLVIPILVDRASPPPEEALPPELASLAYRHAAEMRAGPDLESHLKRLISGLNDALATHEVAEAKRKQEAEAEAEAKRTHKAEEAGAEANREQEAKASIGREALLTVLRWHWGELGYLIDLPPKKQTAVRKNFDDLIPPDEEILAFIRTTMWGGLGSGVAFTVNRVAWRNGPLATPKGVSKRGQMLYADFIGVNFTAKPGDFFFLGPGRGFSYAGWEQVDGPELLRLFEEIRKLVAEAT